MYFFAGLFAVGAAVLFAISLDTGSRDNLVFSITLFFFACVLYGLGSIMRRLPEQERD